MNSIEERVKRIVCEQLNVRMEDISDDSSFMDDLGADSLDAVEFIMALEDEFKAEISDADAEKITSVGQAIEYIKEKAPV